MRLKAILDQYQVLLKQRYANRLLPSMFRAINALLCCRTPAAGLFRLQCGDCDQQALQPRSCGHRSCVQCQHHETSAVAGSTSR